MEEVKPKSIAYTFPKAISTCVKEFWKKLKPKDVAEAALQMSSQYRCPQQNEERFMVPQLRKCVEFESKQHF